MPVRYVNLKFMIGDNVLLDIDLDLWTKASWVNSHVDENILKPILLPSEWNYGGIESRFRYWFNDPVELPAFIASLKYYGFHYNGQANLNVVETDLEIPKQLAGKEPKDE